MGSHHGQDKPRPNVRASRVHKVDLRRQAVLLSFGYRAERLHRPSWVPQEGKVLDHQPGRALGLQACCKGHPLSSTVREYAIKEDAILPARQQQGWMTIVDRLETCTTLRT
jgi:hypothetical protein